MCLVLRKRNEKASMSMIVTSDTNSANDALVLSSNATTSKNVWKMIDSKAPYHMTSDMSCFISYRKTDGGVLMGNDAFCRMVGEVWILGCLIVLLVLSLTLCSEVLKLHRSLLLIMTLSRLDLRVVVNENWCRKIHGIDEGCSNK